MLGSLGAGRKGWIDSQRTDLKEFDALPTGTTDEDLLSAATSDPAAFGILYDRYSVRVYRYCFRRLGSKEAAEDATSAIFTKALEALPRFREGRAFAPWLFAIAHHAVIDVHRQGRTTLPIESIQERLDPDPSPETHALAAEEQAGLRDMLETLPADQRRALEYRLAGLTGAEVASAMGRSRRAVKMLQFRGISRLRVLLGVNPQAMRTEGIDDR